MSIPWKAWANKAWRLMVTVIRTTAPDKGQADPPPPSADEAFDRWKNGAAALLLTVGLALAAPLQAQSATCYTTGRVAADSLGKVHLRSTRLTGYQARALRTLDSLHRTMCPTAPDTAPPVNQPPSAAFVDTCVLRPNGNYRCTFDATSTTDPDGPAPLAFRWQIPNEPVSTNATVVAGLKPGAHAITLVATDSAGAADTVTRTITLATAPIDTTSPPDTSGGGVLPPPVGVELPRLIPPVPAALATAECTVTVTSALQAALNGARAGDVLCLSGTFVGAFTLPARTDSGWVVVRSLASVAAPGERMRPSIAGPLAVVRGVGQAPTFATTGAARGWYLRELDIQTDSIAAVVWTVVDFAPRSSDLVLDRVWVHPPADRPSQRCVALNSGAATVVDSWLGECHHKGFDSQAIWGYNGPGPYRIENNTLEGVGENIMFGGADPTVAGLIPSDITIRRNWIVTPLAWKGRWTKKNSFELKNARRVLVEANVIDGSWGDGQTGIAVMIRSSNQGGKCRWCGSSDITIRRNLLVNVAGAFALFGGATDANPVDSVTRRVLLEENYADVGGPVVGMDNRLNLYLSRLTDATLRRNTYTKAPLNIGNSFTGADVGAPGPVRLTIDRDVYPRGAYGPMGQWTATAAPGLSVPALAIVGGGSPITVVPNARLFASLDAALAAGFGVSRATIDAATAGVVVLP